MEQALEAMIDAKMGGDDFEDDFDDADEGVNGRNRSCSSRWYTAESRRKRGSTFSPGY